MAQEYDKIIKGNLQPLVLERAKHMALTIDITKDFFYQQGEERGEKRGKESKALEIAATC
jgi:hypothetical protein